MEVDAGGDAFGRDTEMATEQPGALIAEGMDQVTCWRSELLQEAFGKAVSYALRDPTREEFGDHFLELDDEIVDALYETFVQTMALVRSHCQEEFQEVCSEHRVHEELRNLDQESGPQPSTSATPLQRTRRSLGGSELPVAAATTPGAAARASGDSGATAAVVRRAEEVARVHALRQEAAYLQDLLERAHTTEARLAEALSQRKKAVEDIEATYSRVVSDVKQVVDVTRAWPATSRHGVIA